MKTILVLSIIIIILLVFVIKLWLKIRLVNKKIKYVDQANEWHKLAVTDSLTGVRNRNAYDLYISEIETGVKAQLIGVILFDVDDFKIINDTKGHLAGDIILKNVAKILSEVFCETQYKVFRIGGDEFSVITEGVCEQEIIERLLVLKKRLEADGTVSLSKGYSIIKNSPQEAFKYADDMLYADKLSKKLRSSLSKDT